LKKKSGLRGYVIRIAVAIALSVIVLGAANADLRSLYNNGQWNNVGGGWMYFYNSPVNDGYWLYNGVIRFSLDYDYGRWWHYGTSWSTLSGTGLTDANFVGNGSCYYLNNGWWYSYAASIGSGYWNTGSAVRFGYDYAHRQWWNYSSWGSWSALGSQGVSQVFVADGLNHYLNNGWYYSYAKPIDSGYWNGGSSVVFGYAYASGQWWDYTFNGWGRLGALTGMSCSFIGDGAYHTWTGGDSFIYRPAEHTYYWRSGSTDWYRYNFVAGTWQYHGSAGGSWYSMTYGGDAQNPDCRYLYNGLFVERGLYYDTGNYAPAGRQEVYYDVYKPSTGWSLQAQWIIHRAGSDNNWSGGDLNVVWGNTRHSGGEDFNQRYCEFTNEDVIFIAADFEENPIGFSTMVDWMTWIRDYYRTQIRTVEVLAHGNSSGWQMGEWMDVYNYTGFRTDWERWGALMTADGQLVSIHCEAGNATKMLDAIHNWSGMDIYANTNTTWTVWWWVNGSGENSSIWNSNYNKVTWYDNSSSYMSRWFEYTTTGSQDYRWILQY